MEAEEGELIREISIKQLREIRIAEIREYKHETINHINK